LPERYRQIYLDHYIRNREGGYRTTSLSQRLEGWMHRQVAADVAPSTPARSGREPGDRPLATLEIGAGTLNHLRHEPPVGPYDIVEPFGELFAESDQLARVRHRYSDIAEIPANVRYDRINSIAAFEHIVDLPPVVARAALLLEEGGALRVGIPNEGTLLWALGTRVTGFEFKRRYGLDYQVLMRYEHVATADEIEAVLRHFFGSVACRVLGLNRVLAVYRFLECRRPVRDVASSILTDSP